jgi:hypothetical protein
MTTFSETRDVGALPKERFGRRQPTDRELTAGELDRIAAGVTPSIPIPPPRPR